VNDAILGRSPLVLAVLLAERRGEAQRSDPSHPSHPSHPFPSFSVSGRHRARSQGACTSPRADAIHHRRLLAGRARNAATGRAAGGLWT
jgi:hypothetical protein